MSTKAKDIAIIGALGLATIYVLSMLVGREVKQAANAVNPLNNDNIFARGVDAIGDIVTDGENDNDFSLGSWIYDVTHPSVYPEPPATRKLR